MADPDFDVSRYYKWTSEERSVPIVEFYVTSDGTLSRFRLKAGNAILLGKKLQREGEAILADRKGKKNV